MRIFPKLIFASALLLTLAACSRKPESISDSRFIEPDHLFNRLKSNIHTHPELEVIVDIDHARLAAEAGAPMPPSHVLIWSDPELDAAILKINPLAAIDLPLRILAFENQLTGKAAVIANRFDFLVKRHALPDDDEIRSRYEAAVADAAAGIPPESIAEFSSDTVPGGGLITLDSPYGFAATETRILEAIDAQSDTVHFGKVDFAERAGACGVRLEPMRLVLFGGPGPGGKAMKSAPTLGLDAFCQKLLIWQDPGGTVHVTFNDLLALAERQEVSGGLPLRVINRRLMNTFTKALEQ